MYINQNSQYCQYIKVSIFNIKPKSSIQQYLSLTAFFSNFLFIFIKSIRNTFVIFIITFILLLNDIYINIIRSIAVICFIFMFIKLYFRILTILFYCFLYSSIIDFKLPKIILGNVESDVLNLSFRIQNTSLLQFMLSLSKDIHPFQESIQSLIHLPPISTVWNNKP